MLRRKFYDTLLKWKQNHKNECLLVKGARQVGKTFIINKFGSENYASYLYVNFIENPECRQIFSSSLEANDLFKSLSIMFQDFRLIPGDTLIFLDEIQNCPKARTALKPLAIDERADVVASGSLLGLTYLDDGLTKERNESSIPVGYERQMTMHSLDFEEYLWAIGYRDDAIDALKEAYETLTPLADVTNRRLHKFFREYVTVGGMPDVVNRFVGENSFSAAFEAQRKIIDSNLDDIAKYAPTADKPKIRACYLSIPNQLARENKKFKFSAVESGGTTRKFGNAVDWLRESSLCLQCHNVETPDLPIGVYKKPDCYKLYMSDIGTLTAMMGFGVKKAIVDDTLVGFAKGGIYENAIMAFLVRRGYSPCYYLPKPNIAEVDFLIENENGVVPIEVKAGDSASASFNRMLERDSVKVGYKFTGGNVGRVGKKITLPHYMAMFV